MEGTIRGFMEWLGALCWVIFCHTIIVTTLGLPMVVAAIAALAMGIFLVTKQDGFLWETGGLMCVCGAVYMLPALLQLLHIL